MKKYLLLIMVVLMGACIESPTAPQTTADDYALVIFGEEGSALEGTMGTQTSRRPFDGRTGLRPFPDSLKLSQVQIDSIKALRQSFVTSNKTNLDALKVIFQRARDAREGGATRVEVFAILREGRVIQDALSPAVKKLHDDIFKVYTPAQREWIESHRRVACMAFPGCPKP